MGDIEANIHLHPYITFVKLKKELCYLQQNGQITYTYTTKHFTTMLF
jgi:hypothetical protein